MKRAVILVFSGVLLVTCILAGYYFYVSGRAQTIVNNISGKKFSVNSQETNIKIKIVDQGRMDSYLVRYDILGKSKNINLPDATDTKADVNQIQLVTRPTDMGYGQIYKESGSDVVIFSSYPKYYSGTLEIELYINGDWFNSLSPEEGQLKILSQVLQKSYIYTHKITMANHTEILSKLKEINDDILVEKPVVMEISKQ